MIMWRKEFCLGALFVLLACVVLWASPSAAQNDWEKYVTADGFMSFYYPGGWIVREHETGFVITTDNNSEQLWLVVLPL